MIVLILVKYCLTFFFFFFASVPVELGIIHVQCYEADFLKGYILARFEKLFAVFLFCIRLTYALQLQKFPFWSTQPLYLFILHERLLRSNADFTQCKNLNEFKMVMLIFVNLIPRCTLVLCCLCTQFTNRFLKY